MSLLTSLQSSSLLPSPIIPTTFTPSISLTITFPNAFTPSEGSLARVSQVSSEPVITASHTDSTKTTNAKLIDQKHTFMLIDPDAPTPADPKFGYWRHWIVTSVPSTSLNAGQSITSAGRTLTPYLAPGPKDESGPHRYLFLLFKEPAGLELGKGDVDGDEFVERRSFRAEEWVEKHGLELVGVQWMRGVGDGWKEGKDEL